MLKDKNALFILLLLLIGFLPLIGVHAASRTINSEADLKSALQDTSVTEIVLGSNIETHEKINITRPVTIDGKGHSITYVGNFGDEENDFTVWAGIYVLQVYKTTATIRDIKLTGGNAALLVNGSTVKLEGTIDVSGNGFGGIELGQGVNVDEIVHLEMDNSTNIVNTTESADTPSLWVPTDSDPAVLEVDGEEQTLSPGEEVTVKEINNLFEIQPNPQTGDKINDVLFIALMSMITLIGSATVFLKRN